MTTRANISEQLNRLQPRLSGKASTIDDMFLPPCQCPDCQHQWVSITQHGISRPRYSKLLTEMGATIEAGLVINDIHDNIRYLFRNVLAMGMILRTGDQEEHCKEAGVTAASRSNHIPIKMWLSSRTARILCPTASRTDEKTSQVLAPPLHQCRNTK